MTTAKTTTRIMATMGLGLGVLSCAACSSAPPASAPANANEHALALDVTLKPANDGELAFLSPSNTILEYAPSRIVGKPYLVATFHAGFSPGNDPPIDHEWGQVPADLHVRYATPSTYGDGAYDVVFIVYTTTPITPDVTSGPVQSAPAAKGGDLASFTLDTSAVRPGDPKNALGTIRLNVAGANASVALENRTPANPSDAAQTTAAFADTILAIP
jgi:hypothetical protein